MDGPGRPGGGFSAGPCGRDLAPRCRAPRPTDSRRSFSDPAHESASDHLRALEIDIFEARCSNRESADTAQACDKLREWLTGTIHAYAVPALRPHDHSNGSKAA